MSAYDKTPLDNTARLTPLAEDAETEVNANAQRPQIELGHHLHDGEYAAMEKTEGVDCTERGKGRHAGISVSDAQGHTSND